MNVPIRECASLCKRHCFVSLTVISRGTLMRETDQNQTDFCEGGVLERVSFSFLALNVSVPSILTSFVSHCEKLYCRTRNF